MAEGKKLELRGVCKSFDGVAAVKGLDLALRKGEFLSLLGPSGCGKVEMVSMAWASSGHF